MNTIELALAAALLAAPAFALDASVSKSSETVPAEAESLVAVWGLDLPSVMAAREAGHEWSEIDEAGKLVATSGFSLGTILAMRESGLSWAGVASAVNVDGVDMRDAPKSPAQVRRTAKPRKATKPAPKAEVIKGKGPKMDPARLRGVW